MNQNQNNAAPYPLVPFSYHSHQVRTIKHSDKSIWFVAKDVCDVLGLTNHKDALKRLDDDEKSGVGISDPHGRIQQTNIINESGLYALILRSNKPEARAFRKWVTSEVLPSIRRNGAYDAADPDARLYQKKCTACRQVKPLDEFDRNINNKDGHHARCKKCRRDLERPTATLKQLAMEDDATAMARSDGARAAIALFEKLSRAGKDMQFVRHIIKYREIKHLNLKDTAILLNMSAEQVRNFEILAKTCGFYNAAVALEISKMRVGCGIGLLQKQSVKAGGTSTSPHPDPDRSEAEKKGVA